MNYIAEVTDYETGDWFESSNQLRYCSLLGLSRVLKFPKRKLVNPAGFFVVQSCVSSGNVGPSTGKLDGIVVDLTSVVALIRPRRWDREFTVVFQGSRLSLSLRPNCPAVRCLPRCVTEPARQRTSEGESKNTSERNGRDSGTTGGFVLGRLQQQ